MLKTVQQEGEFKRVTTIKLIVTDQINLKNEA